jgi:uncharacterized membrane protein YcfT
MTADHKQRIEWIDAARGLSILLVVMMHSTLGVEAAFGREGWMHYAVAFATPFRIPAFFLISGLLVARAIDRDWRTFIDSKVLHFVYFYVLWLAIQFAFKFASFASELGIAGAIRLYAEAFIQPFGTLWFIYLLPVFFIVVKILRPVHPAIVWIAAALLEIAHIKTGSVVVDEFASRFVYFYSGYLFARTAFAFADVTRTRVLFAILFVALWAVANAALVQAGWSAKPGVSLMLGYAGAASVIAIAVWLSQSALPAVSYFGRNSIVIYLAFFLPMAATRAALIKSGLIADAGTVSLLVTAAAVVGALLIYWLVRGTRLDFLFTRPDMFRLDTSYRLAAQR